MTYLVEVRMMGGLFHATFSERAWGLRARKLAWQQARKWKARGHPVKVFRCTSKT